MILNFTVGVVLNVGVVLDWLLLEVILYSFSLLGPEFLVAGRSSEVVASRRFEMYGRYNRGQAFWPL